MNAEKKKKQNIISGNADINSIVSTFFTRLSEAVFYMERSQHESSENLLKISEQYKKTLLQDLSKLKKEFWKKAQKLLGEWKNLYKTYKMHSAMAVKILHQLAYVDGLISGSFNEKKQDKWKLEQEYKHSMVEMQNAKNNLIVGEKRIKRELNQLEAHTLPPFSNTIKEFNQTQKQFTVSFLNHSQTQTLKAFENVYTSFLQLGMMQTKISQNTNYQDNQYVTIKFPLPYPFSSSSPFIKMKGMVERCTSIMKSWEPCLLIVTHNDFLYCFDCTTKPPVHETLEWTNVKKALWSVQCRYVTAIPSHEKQGKLVRDDSRQAYFEISVDQPSLLKRLTMQAKWTTKFRVVNTENMQTWIRAFQA